MTANADRVSTAWSSLNILFVSPANHLWKKGFEPVQISAGLQNQSALSSWPNQGCSAAGCPEKRAGWKKIINLEPSRFWRHLAEAAAPFPQIGWHFVIRGRTKRSRKAALGFSFQPGGGKMLLQHVATGTLCFYYTCVKPVNSFWKYAWKHFVHTYSHSALSADSAAHWTSVLFAASSPTSLNFWSFISYFLFLFSYFQSLAPVNAEHKNITWSHLSDFTELPQRPQRALDNSWRTQRDL